MFLFPSLTEVYISRLSSAYTELSCDQLSFAQFCPLFAISSLEDNREQSSDPQRQTRLRASPWKPWPHSPKSTCGNFLFPAPVRAWPKYKGKANHQSHWFLCEASCQHPMCTHAFIKKKKNSIQGSNDHIFWSNEMTHDKMLALFLWGFWHKTDWGLWFPN